MNMKIFSIYDSKSRCYNVPFFDITSGSAVRTFSDIVNDPQTRINKHPTDYLLYEIGEYNDADGSITSKQPFTLLGNGGDFTPVRRSVVSADSSHDGEFLQEPKSMEVN